jgi:ABC-type sulfate/molybdate transport systems ATPase subunit/ABC-type sulfate transport system permease component
VSRRTPLVWLAGLLLVYLAVPLGAFVYRLGTSRVTGFSTAGLWSALRTSVESATIATAVIALTGIPLAWVLAHHHGRLARVAGTLVALPLALPPVMGGILLIYLIGPYTRLGRLFDQRLTGSVAGIVFAQIFVSAPFLVISARSSFAAVDRSLEDLATGLGHGPLSRFWRVDLPVAGSGIRAGLLLAWLRAIGEYGANVIVAYHPYSIPVFTYVQFSGPGIPTTQAPTVLVLGAAGVAAALSQVRLPRRRTGLPPPQDPGPASPTPVAVTFDLDVRAGAFHLRVAHCATSARLAILGPSGSGKSMTLRSIAGLLGPAAGSVAYGGLPAKGPASRRPVGYVPQGRSLLPHLEVADQVRFGREADGAVGRFWLDEFGLAGLERRLPHQLSGGQAQRVSLAAALARRPPLLLLDEPFSALDAPVRMELRTLVRRLQEDGLSTVLVTHDPLEAAELSDEVVVIRQGRVLQAGPTLEVFSRPASVEVARLVGFDNILPGRAVAGGVDLGGCLLPCPGGRPEGREVWVAIRAESVRPERDGPFRGRIVDRTPFGGRVRLDGGMELRYRSTRDEAGAFAIDSFSVIDAGPAGGAEPEGPPGRG